MPTYDFRCGKCKKDFTVIMTLKEREKKKIKCPSCNSSQKVEPVFTSFFAKTSKKSWPISKAPICFIRKVCPIRFSSLLHPLRKKPVEFSREAK